VILFLKGHNFKRHIKLLAYSANVCKILLPGTIAEERELILEPNFKVKGGEIMPLLL
jgi:hypothetical protein